MRLVPEDNNGKIQFFATRVGWWTERAAEIGTTDEDVAALAADLAEAKAANAAQQVAQAAAMAATLRRDIAIEKLARRGASIIQQVRARAARAGDSVYALASISPPADPSPLGAPGTPQRFEVELQDGRLLLRWKCKNPRGATGTIYQLARSVDGGPMTFLGVTGDRSFTDATIPGGTREILYKVRGVRSTKVGAAALHTVALSSDGSRGLPLPQSSSGKTMLVAA